ncbi:cobalamin B12-binding domain-containing protein [Sinanaerobacter chloroacetimidivorans]|uniref:Corrinoid protein n=1 Tax=Sinanaerobacter chloroacetimidivorans TaxID=2818044 RepID=A0A8J7VYC4_9FIRM|nr:corrinoid protein [Sinanaerobacter chloroacetimidivorans]MBR0597362.1 corrinoid protein [Sinanaerobacter chloroacetimidivorans]
MSKIFKKIMEAVEEGDKEEVIALVQEGLEDGETPQSILNDGLLEGMNLVGEQFKQGTIFVPEVLMSAQTVDAGMEILKPLLNAGDIKNAGKIVFCTVEGDLHDIGKKLCSMLLQGAGYEVIDLGADVAVDRILDGVKVHKPDILAMSAMLTTTMLSMDTAVESLKKEGLDQVAVMIGGAPLSNDYALKIGANYSEDAVGAVELADRLLGN